MYDFFYHKNSKSNGQIFSLAELPVDLHVPLLQGDQNFVHLLGDVKQILQERRK